MFTCLASNFIWVNPLPNELTLAQENKCNGFLNVQLSIVCLSTFIRKQKCFHGTATLYLCHATLTALSATSVFMAVYGIACIQGLVFGPEFISRVSTYSPSQAMTLRLTEENWLAVKRLQNKSQTLRCHEPKTNQTNTKYYATKYPLNAVCSIPGTSSPGPDIVFF